MEKEEKININFVNKEIESLQTEIGDINGLDKEQMSTLTKEDKKELFERLSDLEERLKINKTVLKLLQIPQRTIENLQVGDLFKDTNGYRYIVDRKSKYEDYGLFAMKITPNSIHGGHYIKTLKIDEKSIIPHEFLEMWGEME